MPWEKQFDKSKALDRAQDAFWEGGYEATSMAVLLKRMGIQKGSFYATFGSKRQVLLEALERYVEARSSGFGALHAAPSARAALERHLRALAEEACTSRGDRGCFMVNTALELSGRDDVVREVVQRGVRTLEQHYFRLLESARAEGELPANVEPRRTARALLALVLGIHVLSHSATPRAVIEAVRDHAIALLGPRAGRKEGNRAE